MKWFLGAFIGSMLRVFGGDIRFYGVTFKRWALELFTGQIVPGLKLVEETHETQL